MIIINEHIVDELETAQAALSTSVATFRVVGEADYLLVRTHCDAAGTTSCVWGLELGDSDARITDSPAIELDASFPPNPLAGQHTVLKDTWQTRLFDVRGVGYYNVRLITRTAGDEKFSYIAKLLQER